MTVIIDGSSGVNISSTTGVINLLGSTSGVITLVANAVAGTNTLTLPNVTGTLAVSATPNVTVYTSGSGNYSTPTGAKYLIVELCGAGGGGGGTQSTYNISGATGSAGGNTTFGSLTGGGGSGGPVSAVPAAGGSASGGDVNIIGGVGVGSCLGTGFGSSGGVNPFGGISGGGGDGQQPGTPAPNSGAGGGSSGSSGSRVQGGGGSAGGYVRKIFTSPASTYSYAVGAGGAAGANTVGNTSLNGASGIIIVTAYF